MERLVDVLLHEQVVLHTYPVMADGLDDAACQEKAAKAAAYAKLVPEAELAGLTTRIHVDRGGPLAPYGDRHDILTQTRGCFEQSVRERAYSLWQRDGCPDGRADEHWHRAYEQHVGERAYQLWQREGCPAGSADRHWRQIREFEAI